MASQSNIKGLQHAFRTLKQIDPKLEKEAKKRLKGDVKPIVTDAKSRIPGSPPLSRWTVPKAGGVIDIKDKKTVRYAGKSRLPVWNSGSAKRRIGVSLARKRVKGFKGRRTLIAVRQMDASGAAFDMAGRATNNTFGQNLSSATGLKASRYMWPAAEKHMGAVRNSIKDSIKEIEKQINAELRSRV